MKITTKILKASHYIVFKCFSKFFVYYCQEFYTTKADEHTNVFPLIKHWILVGLHSSGNMENYFHCGCGVVDHCACGGIP